MVSIFLQKCLNELLFSFMAFCTASISTSLALSFAAMFVRNFLLFSSSYLLEAWRASISLIIFFSVISCFFWSRRISSSISLMVVNFRVCFLLLRSFSFFSAIDSRSYSSLEGQGTLGSASLSRRPPQSVFHLYKNEPFFSRDITTIHNFWWKINFFLHTTLATNFWVTFTAAGEGGNNWVLLKSATLGVAFIMIIFSGGIEASSAAFCLRGSVAELSKPNGMQVPLMKLIKADCTILP